MLDIVEGVGRVDREANEDNVCFAVCKRAQTLVIFLSSRIPQSKLYGLAVYSAVSDVVFKNCWDISLRGGVSMLG